MFFELLLYEKAPRWCQLGPLGPLYYISASLAQVCFDELSLGRVVFLNLNLRSLWGKGSFSSLNLGVPSELRVHGSTQGRFNFKEPLRPLLNRCTYAGSRKTWCISGYKIWLPDSIIQSISVAMPRFKISLPCHSQLKVGSSINKSIYLFFKKFSYLTPHKLFQLIFCLVQYLNRSQLRETSSYQCKSQLKKQCSSRGTDNLSVSTKISTDQAQDTIRNSIEWGSREV